MNMILLTNMIPQTQIICINALRLCKRIRIMNALTAMDSKFFNIIIVKGIFIMSNKAQAHVVNAASAL